MTFKEFYILKERFTDEQKNDIINSYNKNLKITDIAKKYGVVKGTLYYYLRKWKVPIHNTYERLTDEEKLQIAIEYESGKPLREIVRDYDINPKTVFNIKNLFNISNQHKAVPILDSERNKIIELASKMDDTNEHYLYSDSIIGQKFNRDHKFIQKVTKRFILPSGISLLDDRRNKGVYSSEGKIYVRNQAKAAKLKSSKQQAFGPLGPNDPSYRFAMGRAQDIHDKDIK